MNKKNFAECERRSMNKLLNFRLSYSFKIIGIVIFVLSLVLLFTRLVFPDQSEVLKEIARKGIVMGMLLISLARDKEEDELTVHLRAQSYAIAFIVGVLYALVMPYVDYGVSNVIKSEGEAFKDLGDFQVLSFMLMIQLLYYHVLKRYR